MCRSPRGCLSLVLAVLFAVVAGGPTARVPLSRAAEVGNSEPPGVARVSLVDGDVSYLRGDAEEWSRVGVNAPLVTGDRFYVAPEARAEIQLDPTTYVRLAPSTQLDLLELGPDVTQIRLGVGAAILRVRRAPGGRHIEVGTPALAVVAESAGLVRIDVDEAGATRVAVRDGRVWVHVGDERMALAAGQGVRVDEPGGRGALVPIDVADTGEDSVDAWERERASRASAPVSAQYVNDEIYGLEDLDEQGTWEYRRGYGQVWRPTVVAAGWAPYSTGRWTWVDPWGWSWVDAAPWGWAPFHYGRWVWVDDSWWWAPGPLVARPIYAPALVGFVGWNSWSGLSVGVAVGAAPPIGWIPLGWGEPCLPWWGGWGGVVVGRPWWGGWGGPRIVNQTIIQNQTIQNIQVGKIVYVNGNAPNGTTAVSRRVFVSGGNERLRLARADLDGARPIAGAVPITPAPASLSPVDPAVAAVSGRAIPPGSILQRAAVTTRTPVAAAVPFTRKRPLVEESGGTPLSPGRLRALADPAPQVDVVTKTGLRTVFPARAAATVSAEQGNGDSTLRRQWNGSPAHGSEARDVVPSSSEPPAAIERGATAMVPVVRPPEGSASTFTATSPRGAAPGRRPYVAERPAWQAGAREPGNGHSEIDAGALRSRSTGGSSDDPSGTHPTQPRALERSAFPAVNPSHQDSNGGSNRLRVYSPTRSPRQDAATPPVRNVAPRVAVPPTQEGIGGGAPRVFGHEPSHSLRREAAPPLAPAVAAPRPVQAPAPPPPSRVQAPPSGSGLSPGGVSVRGNGSPSSGLSAGGAFGGSGGHAFGSRPPAN